MSRRFLTGLRERALRSPRWFAGSAAALLLALAVFLAIADLPKPVSGMGDTFASLLRNLITASVLATLAYLWFYFWTGERATRHLLRAAQRAPERLFPNPDEAAAVELIYGREHLVGEIAAGLRRRSTSGPQIVVGEGRTMPYCLTTSRNRAEFEKGCHDQCTLRLCPYQPVRDRLSAHREISRAFCRDQRFNASSRTSRHWGSSVSSRSLAEFWKELESRAQF